MSFLTFGVTIQMKRTSLTVLYFNTNSQDFTKRNLDFFWNFLFLASEGVKVLKVIEERTSSLECSLTFLEDHLQRK